MAQKTVDRKTFRCMSCNWKFRKESQPKLCPYCGKSNSVESDSKQGAEAIIKELDEMRGPFRS